MDRKIKKVYFIVIYTIADGFFLNPTEVIDNIYKKEGDAKNRVIELEKRASVRDAYFITRDLHG